MRIKGEMNFDLLDIGLQNKQDKLVWKISETGTNYQTADFPIIKKWEIQLPLLKYASTSAKCSN